MTTRAEDNSRHVIERRTPRSRLIRVLCVHQRGRPFRLSPSLENKDILWQPRAYAAGDRGSALRSGRHYSGERCHLCHRPGPPRLWRSLARRPAPVEAARSGARACGRRPPMPSQMPPHRDDVRRRCFLKPGGEWKMWAAGRGANRAAVSFLDPLLRAKPL